MVRDNNKTSLQNYIKCAFKPSRQTKKYLPSMGLPGQMWSEKYDNMMLFIVRYRGISLHGATKFSD
jgi:hypothetical protein